ncbi:MAG: tetratricopeptide repeat protein [Bryobacterales bacterium]|nr:tetratricopeptide repeat protein [Bryobacterales bacterium]
MTIFALGFTLLLAQDPAALSSQAAAAMRAQKFPEAESLYRKLTALQPANPMWRMNLGLALYSSGQYEKSIPEFELFHKSKPAPGPTHLILGTALLKLGKSCPAVTPLETAARWDMQRSTPPLADAYFGCKRYALAARAYEAAGPASARRAAHCYWQARQYPEARRIFETLEKSHPNDPEFHYEFGDTLARTAGPEAALPHLRQAVEANPELLPARGELGKALLATGDAPSAIPHLEAASAAGPTLLLPLSRAYRAAGRTADADRAQQQYRRHLSAK